MKLTAKSRSIRSGSSIFEKIKDFDGARNSFVPEERLKEIRKRSIKFREKMLSGKKVIYYRTFDLVRVPYPTKYGFLNAFSLPTPFMHIINRLFVIQFKSKNGIKTLLFSPSDISGNKETPFFKNLSRSFGPFAGIGEKFIAPVLGNVEDCLAKTGIRPEQVDYISYDHLHTQDVRKWLGTNSSSGYFPNAKLIVTKQEWESANGLLPPQKTWYCPNGISGLDKSRIIFFEGDIQLGEGISFIHTPGHTEGNHSLVVHTDPGILVSSENGVGADSYSPLHSEIAGLRKFARRTNMEVVLNGNTLEGALDQYISMVQEKEMAGRSEKNPDFYNVVTSSEMASYWAFPGLKPTFSFGPLEFGSPVLKI